MLLLWEGSQNMVYAFRISKYAKLTLKQVFTKSLGLTPVYCEDKFLKTLYFGRTFSLIVSRVQRSVNKEGKGEKIVMTWKQVDAVRLL